MSKKNETYARKFQSLLTGPLGEARYEKPAEPEEIAASTPIDGPRYKRTHWIPFFDIFTVITTEKDDIKYFLPPEALEQTKSFLESQGKPTGHLQPAPSDKWYRILADDIVALFLLILDFYQLVSFSFLLDLPWIVGVLLTTGLPGPPNIRLPSGSYSIPPIPELFDMRKWAFRWAVFDFFDYSLDFGAYKVWLITATVAPWLAIAVFSIYFVKDRFFKRKILRQAFNFAASMFAGPFYLPIARALMSPFECVEAVTPGGTAGNWISMSLDLDDPHSCDSEAYPFITAACSVSFLCLFVIVLTMSMLDKKLRRPSTRYNARLFVNGRAAMLPLCVLTIAKTGYVLADILKTQVPLAHIAWAHVSFASLIALSVWLYPMYFKKTAAFLNGAFLAGNLYVAVVTAMHAQGSAGLDDPKLARDALLYGIGPAWVFCGILSILGYYAWGMQEYTPHGKKKRPAGEFPPIFPFGLGIKLDIFGQQDTPLAERETCSLGGSVPKFGRQMAHAFGWSDRPVVREYPPDPLSMTRGRPGYVLGACCATTEEGETRACNKFRMGHCLYWIFLFPLALRDCIAVTLAESSNPPAPKGSVGPKPGEPVKAKMALWWLCCFPFALHSRRAEQDASERPNVVADVFSWLTSPFANFNRDFEERRARYESDGPEIADYGSFFAPERVKTFLHWLFCFPLAYKNSFRRRYAKVLREWYVARHRVGEAPEVTPAKRTPSLAKEALYNTACFPCAMWHRRHYYGQWPHGWSWIRELLFWILLPPVMLLRWWRTVIDDYRSGRHWSGNGGFCDWSLPSAAVVICAALRCNSVGLPSFSKPSMSMSLPSISCPPKCPPSCLGRCLGRARDHDTVLVRSAPGARGMRDDDDESVASGDGIPRPCCALCPEPCYQHCPGLCGTIDFITDLFVVYCCACLNSDDDDKEKDENV